MSMLGLDFDVSAARFPNVLRGPFARNKGPRFFVIFSSMEIIFSSMEILLAERLQACILATFVQLRVGLSGTAPLEE